jgi:hypothetical protein
MKCATSSVVKNKLSRDVKGLVLSLIFSLVRRLVVVSLVRRLVVVMFTAARGRAAQKEG